MLLGPMPDGSDGYTGMSAEGPISMRQRNMDPACSTRVVPACRREGSTMATTCDPAAQYFAWPSRRVVQVARRFAERYNNGTVSSICRNDYSSALTQIVERIQSRLQGRCLSRALETELVACEPGDTRGNCSRTKCIVREILPAGMSTALCTPARGRTAGERDIQVVNGQMVSRETCLINQISLPLGMAPPSGREGFYYDTRPDPASPDCRQHIEFTSGAGLVAGARAVIECVFAQGRPRRTAPAVTA